VEYKSINTFKNEQGLYNKIILITDDDPKFNTDDKYINDKTISIVHSYKNRNPLITTAIAVRPLANEYYIQWAIPIYPCIDRTYKLANISNEMLITIIGDDQNGYNTDIINRIYSDKKIILNAVSRNITSSRFNNINKLIDLRIYKNIDTFYLMNLLYKSSYILTDIASSKDYTNTTMSGAIPLSFNTLTPLIISTDTNMYYNFKNVIEYDKKSSDPIILQQIDIMSLEKERMELLEKNNNLFNSILRN
jgi:hypothetical protein